MSTAETFGINSIGPEQMGLDITNHCNMRCRHCYNRSNEGGGIGLGRELSDAELYDFAKTVRKLLPVGFCFCGGEPLLRYDAIIEFIKIASNSFTKFSMVTNGYLMTLDKMRGLRDVGLNTIQVSIDGVDAATHEALRGVCGGYEKAIETLRLAKENKIPKRAVAFSPTRFNIEQFPSVTVQMKNLGVSEVRIQPLIHHRPLHRLLLRTECGRPQTGPCPSGLPGRHSSVRGFLCSYRHSGIFLRQALDLSFFTEPCAGNDRKGSDLAADHQLRRGFLRSLLHL